MIWQFEPATVYIPAVAPTLENTSYDPAKDSINAMKIHNFGGKKSLLFSIKKNENLFFT